MAEERKAAPLTVSLTNFFIINYRHAIPNGSLALIKDLCILVCGLNFRVGHVVAESVVHISLFNNILSRYILCLKKRFSHLDSGTAGPVG